MDTFSLWAFLYLILFLLLFPRFRLDDLHYRMVKLSIRHQWRCLLFSSLSFPFLFHVTVPASYYRRLCFFLPFFFSFDLEYFPRLFTTLLCSSLLTLLACRLV